MALQTSIRLDDETHRALVLIERSRRCSRSEAIRRAILEASRHLIDPDEVAREVALVRDDADEQRISAELMEFMDDAAVPW